jgi:hypothetical protein
MAIAFGTALEARRLSISAKPLELSASSDRAGRSCRSKCREGTETRPLLRVGLTGSAFILRSCGGNASPMPASLSLSHFAVLARDRNGFGYFGRANTILLERERIKRQNHRKSLFAESPAGRLISIKDDSEPSFRKQPNCLKSTYDGQSPQSEMALRSGA